MSKRSQITTKDLENRILLLEKETETLRNKPKDIFDKLQVLGSIAIPVLVVLVGYFVNQKLEDNKNEVRFQESVRATALAAQRQEEARRSREAERALIAERDRIAKLSIIPQLIKDIASEQEVRQRVALETIKFFLTEEEASPLLALIEEQGASDSIKGEATKQKQDQQTNAIDQLFSTDFLQRRSAFDSLSKQPLNTQQLNDILTRAESQINQPEIVDQTLNLLRRQTRSTLGNVATVLSDYVTQLSQGNMHAKNQARNFRQQVYTRCDGDTITVFSNYKAAEGRWMGEQGIQVWADKITSSQANIKIIRGLDNVIVLATSLQPSQTSKFKIGDEEYTFTLTNINRKVGLLHLRMWGNLTKRQCFI